MSDRQWSDYIVRFALGVGMLGGAVAHELGGFAAVGTSVAVVVLAAIVAAMNRNAS